MRVLTDNLVLHLAQDVTTLAVCWRVTRRDGVQILGTEHDRDLTITEGDYAGTYMAAAGITGSTVQSTSDLSVDNLEVNGAINNTGDLTLIDLTVADIESGLMDNAQVTLLMVNWEAPDDGQVVLRTGTIGEISRTSEGQYKTELRGLTQYLSKNLLRSYGTACDADFGDARCGIDLVALTVTGTVTAVTSNRRFVATLDDSPGTVMDTELFLPMYHDIAVGDTFTIRPGCDKSMPMCKIRFNNIANFRGHGLWTPGTADMMDYGGKSAKVGGGSILDIASGLIQEMIDRWLAAIEANRPNPIDSPDSPWYDGGLITFTSGDNSGYAMEVKRTLPP